MNALFLAHGFEEIEAVTTIDTLRRAGIELTVVGISARTVYGNHNIGICADMTIDEFVSSWASCECVILPGGMPGVDNLEMCEPLKQAVLDTHKSGGLVCAICAAPRILSHLGLLDGMTVSAHPCVHGEIKNAEISDEPSVICGRLVSGSCPGAAVDFALNIVKCIKGEDTARAIADGIFAR